MSYEIERVLI